MTFRSSILAGTTLVREAVQSQDYTPGSAGWSINADGSAEFNDVVIRGGTVVSGTALYYDPSPGPGTLIMSIAAEAGTDQYGNAYEGGVSWYEAGTPVVQLGGDLDDLFGMAGVTALDADSGRVAALTNGSVAFLPTDPAEPYARSAGGGLIYFGEYDPAVMRLQLISGRAVSGQRYALINLDSATTGVKAEVALAADSVATGDFRFSVYGETRLKGAITEYAADTFETWTPVISGGGTATFDVRDGWYQRVGKMIYVYATWSVGTAGSGASAVTVSLPVVPWRGTASRRQTISGDVSGASPEGPLSGVIFAGGAGATLQRIQMSDGTDAIGTDLAAGSIWILQGWLREA
ncbi:hypothetical protein ACFW34_35110 [Streptomyces sp. NPDC058848]|uniref:hypothetical protein n=1 Tax=Streptomyces sp. NPDC058848 TaxID=3346650 RepID=UPI0036C6DDC2